MCFERRQKNRAKRERGCFLASCQEQLGLFVRTILLLNTIGCSSSGTALGVRFLNTQLVAVAAAALNLPPALESPGVGWGSVRKAHLVISCISNRLNVCVGGGVGGSFENCEQHHVCTEIYSSNSIKVRTLYNNIVTDPLSRQ